MIVTTNINVIAEHINELIHQNKQIIIAIDGMSGSGKTLLGETLAKEFVCNLIHTDDFYLPSALRCKKRSKEIGGNIDYVRLKNEVIDKLSEPTLNFSRYDCRNNTFVSLPQINKNQITIIEGSYALHPYFGKYYDLAIFVSVSKVVQYNRLFIREGEDKIENFTKKWIPFENKYFEEFKIQDKSDIVYSTTILY